MQTIPSHPNRRTLAEQAPQPLEQELAELLRAARLDARQTRALTVRLGWSGGAPTTLAAAAATEGYTRERVRQLEQRLVRYAARAALRLPATEEGLRLLEAAAPSARFDLARSLAASGISAQPFDPAGLLRAAELAGLDSDVVVQDGLVLRREEGELAATVLATARALVREHGAASVRLLAHRLEGGGLTLSSVRRLLELREEVVWLDRRHEWLLVPVGRTRATSPLRKMLSVARWLTLTDLDDGLRRSGRPVALPREILRALCRSLDWLTLDPGSDVVSASVPLDPARVLSPLEHELVRIFRAAGPVLGFTKAVHLAGRAGLNPTSAGLYLGRSPVLQTVARGRYALRGYGAEIVPLAAV